MENITERGLDLLRPLAYQGDGLPVPPRAASDVRRSILKKLSAALKQKPKVRS